MRIAVQVPKHNRPAPNHDPRDASTDSYTSECEAARILLSDSGYAANWGPGAENWSEPLEPRSTEVSRLAATVPGGGKKKKGGAWWWGGGWREKNAPRSLYARAMGVCKVRVQIRAAASYVRVGLRRRRALQCDSGSKKKPFLRMPILGQILALHASWICFGCGSAHCSGTNARTGSTTQRCS
jgi:hypothetical protein